MLIEQNDSARTTINRALHLGQRNPKADPLLAQAFCLSGYLYSVEGKVDWAKKAFGQALKKAMKWPQSRSWGIQARVNLAYLSSSEGDYEQTIVHAEEGQQWALLIRDNASRALLLREKAYGLYWLRRYDEATTYAQQAIQLAHTVGQTNLGAYYLLLGDIESKRGSFALAVESYKRAASMILKANDEELQATVQINLGFLYYQQKLYGLAIQCNERALALQKNRLIRARILDNLAACYWKTGQFDKALTLYQQGLNSLLSDFTQTDPTENPPAETVRLALRKEALLTLMQDKADTWLDYGIATNSRQRLIHALNTYQKVDQMIDYMRWEHTGQQSKLYWRKKTRGIYERAIETCWRLGNAEQAFRFIEKSRAVMLVDKLNELGARQQLSPQQAQQEESLRTTKASLQKRLSNQQAGTMTYDSLQTALTNAQEQFDNFLKRLEQTSPSYFRYRYDTTTTSLDDLQRYLKAEKASFVSYFEGDNAFYVLGVTADGASLTQKPITAHSREVREFKRLLASTEALNRRSELGRFLTLGYRLYQQVLAPLTLPNGRVIVSSDGEVIPFDVLNRGGSLAEPRYLVNDYAFSYIYSARLLLKERLDSPVFGWSGNNFLGMAPVRFAPALHQATLLGSDEALRSIARQFGASTLLTHQEATRGAFLTQAPACRILQLFTHADADSADREPVIYFADSTLRLSELGDGTLPHTQLAVLTACKTGVGVNQRGEGVFSLARGLASLGVPSVVTTLWGVDSKATYELSRLLFKYLGEGLPKDVALQKAKQDWLRTASRFEQLPNQWAGLILIGDTRPLERASPWRWAAGLILVAGGSWVSSLWARGRRPLG
ncbi:CHAT domain-containing protein [Fibrisoma montanum]|uniref:CHAT domain-containing protein n=1 Tax=Fibrisoma montanum TaxID=2305895 RepID=UPI0013144747|nr:CHAT domain-containing tetratricopeptide repeat protein [Fibrisoma montanum]